MWGETVSPQQAGSRYVVAAVLVLTAWLVAAPAASAAPSEIASGVITDGGVRAIARAADGSTYIGGEFGTVGVDNVPRQSIARLLPNGAVDMSWDVAINGSVRAIKASGTDIYVGGDFISAGSEARPGLAKISSSGVVDPDWNPDPNDVVQDIYVSGNDVFLGGNFTTLNGGAASRASIAKVSATGTGTVDPTWNPGSDGFIFALEVRGGDLYVGGAFSSFGGASRDNIARASTSGSGVVDPDWSPNANGAVEAINAAEDGIYVGGSFAGAGSIGGADRNRVARLSSTGSGQADPTWAPDIDNTVRSIALQRDLVIVGGDFTTANSVSRPHLAAVQRDTGALNHWNPQPDNLVYVVNTNPHNTTVEVGGDFGTVGGTSHPFLATFAGQDPEVSVSPESKDFGSSVIGTSTAQVFTVTNTGVVDLEVGQLAVAGTDASNFKLSADSCSNRAVAPASSCTVTATFVPQLPAAEKTASLVIPSNWLDGPTTVPLTGNATASPTPTVICPTIRTAVTVPSSGGRPTRHGGRSALGVRLQVTPSGGNASLNLSATATYRDGRRTRSLTFTPLNSVTIRDNTARRIGLRLSSQSRRQVDPRTAVSVRIKTVATPLTAGCKTQAASTRTLRTRITKLVLAP